MRIGLKIIGIGVLLLVAVICVTIGVRLLIIERVDSAVFETAETNYLTMSDGTEVAYHVFMGSNRDTIVLVGGLGAWRESWRNTVSEERRRGNEAQFVIVDLPPFGLSRVVPNGSYSRVDQAERIRAVITTVASTSEQVVAVGHSYGGGPVAELLFRSPELVDEVVLISPVVNLDARTSGVVPEVMTWRPLRTALTAVALSATPLQRSRLESFLAITENATYETLALFTEPLRQPGSSGRLGDWLVAYLGDKLPVMESTKSENWTATTVPVTLIWGDQDTLTPITDAYALQALNSEIRVVPLLGVGHIPMLEDVASLHDALGTVWQNEP